MSSSDESVEEPGTGGSETAEQDQNASDAQLREKLAESQEEVARLKTRVQELESVLKTIGASARQAAESSVEVPQEPHYIKMFMETYNSNLQLDFQCRNETVAADAPVVSGQQRAAYRCSLHLVYNKKITSPHKNGMSIIVDNSNLLMILKKMDFRFDAQDTVPFKMTLHPVGDLHRKCHTSDFHPNTPERIFELSSFPSANIRTDTNYMRVFSGDRNKANINYPAIFRFRFAKGITTKAANSQFVLRVTLDIDEALWCTRWAEAGIEAPPIPSATSTPFKILTNDAYARKRKAED